MHRRVSDAIGESHARRFEDGRGLHFEARVQVDEHRQGFEPLITRRHATEVHRVRVPGDVKGEREVTGDGIYVEAFESLTVRVEEIRDRRHDDILSGLEAVTR